MRNEPKNQLKKIEQRKQNIAAQNSKQIYPATQKQAHCAARKTKNEEVAPRKTCKKQKV